MNTIVLRSACTSKNGKVEEVKDWIDDLEEDPIIPDKISGKHQTQSNGWKFYLRIKEYLPDWWDEFNGDTVSKKSGPRSKYRNIKSLVKAKVKDRTSRQYLLWMIGPKDVWDKESQCEDSEKHQVPWLGDWYQRRRNGYWLDGNKSIIKQLRKSFKDNLSNNDAIRATAPFITQVLMRKIRMQNKIDDMFNGEPFYSDEKPDSKNNRMRFNAYRDLHGVVEADIYKAIAWWMRIHGINPKNPHEMADMATLAGAFGQVGASAALTGLTAGMQMLPNPDGSPSGSHVLNTGDNRVLISPDALLLAQHLTKHSTTFKKPLPTTIDGNSGEVIEKEKANGKSNGHTKAN